MSAVNPSCRQILLRIVKMVSSVVAIKLKCTLFRSNSWLFALCFWNIMRIYEGLWLQWNSSHLVKTMWRLCSDITLVHLQGDLIQHPFILEQQSSRCHLHEKLRGFCLFQALHINDRAVVGLLMSLFIWTTVLLWPVLRDIIQRSERSVTNVWFAQRVVTTDKTAKPKQ